MSLGIKILFKPVGKISSESRLDQHLNIKGYLEDFSRICTRSLKNHTRIIMGSNVIRLAYCRELIKVAGVDRSSTKRKRFRPGCIKLAVTQLLLVAASSNLVDKNQKCYFIVTCGYFTEQK